MQLLVSGFFHDSRIVDNVDVDVDVDDHNYDNYYNYNNINNDDGSHIFYDRNHTLMIPDIVLSLCLQYFFVDVYGMGEKDGQFRAYSAISLNWQPDLPHSHSKYSHSYMHANQQIADECTAVVLKSYYTQACTLIETEEYITADYVLTTIARVLETKKFVAEHAMELAHIYQDLAFVSHQLFDDHKYQSSLTLSMHWFDKHNDNCQHCAPMDINNSNIKYSTVCSTNEKKFFKCLRECAAHAYLVEKNYQKALQLYQKMYYYENYSECVSKAKKKCRKYHHFLGVFRLWKIITKCYAQLNESQAGKQWIESEIAQNSLIHNNPQVPQYCYYYAMILFNYFDDYMQAEKYFVMALAIDPEIKCVHVSYGYLLYILNKFKQSEKHLRLAMQESLDNERRLQSKNDNKNNNHNQNVEIDANAFYFFGLVMQSQSQHSAAMLAFKKCLEIDERHAQCSEAYRLLMRSSINCEPKQIAYSSIMTKIVEKYRVSIMDYLMDVRLAIVMRAEKGMDRKSNSNSNSNSESESDSDSNLDWGSETDDDSDNGDFFAVDDDTCLMFDYNDFVSDYFELDEYDCHGNYNSKRKNNNKKTAKQIQRARILKKYLQSGSYEKSQWLMDLFIRDPHLATQLLAFLMAKDEENTGYDLNHRRLEVTYFSCDANRGMTEFRYALIPVLAQTLQKECEALYLHCVERS
jgi:tetratricopeptide (TPR) repeat protein